MTASRQDPHVPQGYPSSRGDQWARDVARRYFLEQWSGKHKAFAAGRREPALDCDPQWSGTRIRLSRWSPGVSCSLQDAMSGDILDQHVERSLWDRLSVLLRLGACVTRYEFDGAWIPHRTYPSPGALFSVDLFVSFIIRSQQSWYRLDPNRHELVAEKPCDGVYELAGRLTEAGTVSLALAAQCHRLERKYGVLSYRLACLEAGHLIQNLLLLATAFSVPWRVNTGGRGGASDVGGLPPGVTRRLMCIVDSQGVIEDYRPRLDLLEVDAGSVHSIRPPSRSPRAPAEGLCHPVSLTEIEAAQAFLRSPSHEGLVKTSLLSGPLRIQRPGMEKGAPSLSSALRDRSSGPSTLVVGRPMAPPALASVCSVLDWADWANENTPARRVYALVARIADTRMGTYRWSPQSRSLELLCADAPPTDIVPRTDQLLSLDLFTCLVVLTADFDGELEHLGPSALRVLNLEAGAAGQRIALVAATQGMVARPLVGCKEDRLGEHLGLLTKREDLLYALALAPATTGPFRVEVP